MKVGWSIAGYVLLALGVALAQEKTEPDKSGLYQAAARTPEEIRTELEAFLQRVDSRVPGSPGNLEMESRFGRMFDVAELPHGAIQFQAPVFQPGPATLTLPGQSPIPIFAMHPTLGRPGNFPTNDFQAPVVYLGRATEEDLVAAEGVNLQGALALVEYDCGERWLRFLRFGVKGFLFLGASSYAPGSSVSKIVTTEANVPRYFIPAEQGELLREQVRAARGAAVARIQAEPSRWHNQALRDMWVLIPGSDPQLGKELVVVVAPLDCNSVVPALAPGAQSAANLYLLAQLFAEFKDRPPARSVLLAAVNGHTQNYLGERMLAWYLLAPQLDVETVHDTLALDRRIQNVYLDRYAETNLWLDGQHDTADTEYLIKLRKLTDESSGKILSIKEPVVAMAKRDVNQLKARSAQLVRMKLSDAEFKRQRDELTARRMKFTNVLMLFNKVGLRTTWTDLSLEERGILRGYVNEFRANNRIWSEMNLREQQVSLANCEIRNVLTNRTVAFVLTLDFDWGTEQFGFSSLNTWGKRRWTKRFGANVMRLAGTLPDEGDRERAGRLLLDTMSNAGGLPEGYYFDGGECFGILPFHAAGNVGSTAGGGGGTAAFSVRNVFSTFGRAFSPGDTLSALPVENVAGVYQVFPSLLRAMLGDRALTMQEELDRPRPELCDGEFTALWSTRLKSFKFDEFAADVMPTTPITNSLLILVDGSATEKPILGGEVVNAVLGLTDERAVAPFMALYRVAPLNCAGFQFDASFTHVQHTLDIGEVHIRVPSSVVNLPEKKLAFFTVGEEFPILERLDSSLIGAVPQIVVPSYLLLEAQNNSSPRKYGFNGALSVLSTKTSKTEASGPAVIYTDGRESIKVLTASKRLALNATAQVPQGAGFTNGQEMLPDFFAIAARDMDTLNRDRIARLRGVSDELAQEFLRKGKQSLEHMEKARTAQHHIGFLQSLYQALGAEVKAYDQQSAVTNDMLKAVVFYMALMLPFCFFLQKLLFKFVRIEAQMAAFVILFILTFLVFRMIHPAFRIAQAPEAMFIAFVMGALGAFVINILHGRFEGEMKLLFHAYLGSDTADIGYSTVTQQAMLIGVNNMKRRRVRTALTTGTIILVTFTMLAFTSISKKMSPTVVAVSKKAHYTGLMYHWTGGTSMDEGSMRVLSEMFTGQGDLFVRRWLLAPSTVDSTYPMRLEFNNNGKVVGMQAAVGLQPGEDGFLAKMPLIPGGRFFSSNNAPEIVLMASTAAALGIVPEALSDVQLSFQGQRMSVVGILDDERFMEIKDIDGMPLVPLKKMISQSSGTAADPASLSMDDNQRGGVIFMDSATVFFMPEGTARLFNAKPYSLSVRLKPEAPVWPAMDRLLTSTSAKFYISSRNPFGVASDSKRKNDPGVYYIGTGYHTAIGGLNVLIIPLLIASTIILNTMLGSVFERKNEIAVFNAVGLNPTHIGTFFLAEAFVYSVIGSIGGYLLGQMLSITLSHFHLVEGINLNFSSLSVVYVIVFTIAVVLLSTLYPAIVATKAAVPSGKRIWSMPVHDGSRMTVALPFIYNPRLVPGILNYLEEYFARYTEASVGDVIARLDEKSMGRDAAGRPVAILRYHVALAPFDLGVTEEVIFRAAFETEVDAYRVDLEIRRVSGQDSNWVTTNRPFLERLRQYLMHWRNLGAAQHALFVERGRQSFPMEVQG